MARKEDPDGTLTERPAMTAAFFVLFCIECVGCTVALRQVGGIGGHGAYSAFAFGLFAVLIVMEFSKAVGYSFAWYCGANKANRRKFGDQTWQLAIHASMTILEVMVLEGEPWYVEPWTCFTGYSVERSEKELVNILYVVQLAIWVLTCFSHHFIEARHKDFYLMCAARPTARWP